MILDDRRKKLPRPGFGQRPLDTENAVRPKKRYSADVFKDLGTLTGLAGAQVPELAARVGAADQGVVGEPLVTAPHASEDHGHILRLGLYSNARLAGASQAC